MPEGVWFRHIVDTLMMGYEQSPPEIQSRVLELRRTLDNQGLDAGADTLQALLAREGVSLGRTTIWRILTRNDAITPQPQKNHGQPGTDSKPTNRIKHGNPMSPIGASATVGRWKSSAGSITTPGFFSTCQLITE